MKEQFKNLKKRIKNKFILNRIGINRCKYLDELINHFSKDSNITKFQIITSIPKEHLGLNLENTDIVISNSNQLNSYTRAPLTVLIFINSIGDEYNKSRIVELVENHNLVLVIDDTLDGKLAIDELLRGEKLGECLSGFMPNSLDTRIVISGRIVNIKNSPNTKTLALVSLFNELDIIEQSVNHLLNNGLDVHVIDNWSDDGGFEKVVEMSKHDSRITYERFPETPQQEYLWNLILERKQEIARAMKYDWYMHYDADEIRVSPWPNCNLKDAISFVDNLGYNAIDFTVLDFRPVVDGFTGAQVVNDFFKYFEIGRRPGHFLQVKAWKANDNVEIVNEGGHSANFMDRKVYPLKFLLKHYPLRSENQANKKIYKDRLPRVEKQIKERGWHTHYQKQSELTKFTWDKSDLIEFNEEFYEKYLLERLTGVGIPRAS